MSWRPPRTHRNLPDPVTSYAVLGERNSGTNYVDALLAANLPAGIPASDVYCWKHGFIDRRVAATGGLLTVVVYRHPVRWLQSLHNKPMELSARMQGLSFGDFIRHEWQGAFARPDGEEPSTADMDPKARTNYPNALRLRAAKIAYLEEMAEMPGRVAFLRFEDANRDPRATLDALGRAFDLPLAIGLDHHVGLGCLLFRALLGTRQFWQRFVGELSRYNEKHQQQKHQIDQGQQRIFNTFQKALARG